MGNLSNIRNIITGILRKKKGILLYLGLHQGDSFDRFFRNYKSCYGFEAHPELFSKIEKKYKKKPHVKLFNTAVTTYNGQISFNISDNEGASSIGTFNSEWDGFKSGQMKMTNTIIVPCINLFDFCQKHKIEFIDDYISDIQGMDLEVLKTMKPYIDDRKIDTITCEVIKNGKRGIYGNLPDNTERGFHELLNNNYELIAKGWGILKNNHFNDVPDDWWEMDCKWRLKQS